MEVDDQVVEIEEKPEEVSLEDTIREAMRAPAETPDPIVAQPEAQQPDRARDETGKFAPKPADTKPRETLSLPEKDAGVKVDPAQQLGVTASKPLPEWMGWKGEARAKFNELPDWARAEVLRREEEAHKTISKFDEERNFGKRVNEMAMPYIPTIKAEGATVEKAFQDYLQTAHILRAGTPTQKASALLSVAQQFNVDLSLPLQQGAQNPQFAHMERQIADLTGRLQGFTQQHQVQEQHSLKSQIEDFSAKPGHEHFERVKVHMGALLENGLATDLEDAYQQAIYAVPDIRSSLLAATTQAETEKRLTEAKAKAEAARRAGGSISGGPGASSPLNGAGHAVPIEETIRAAIRESQGRV